jgi:hypothetical protein
LAEAGEYDAIWRRPASAAPCSSRRSSRGLTWGSVLALAALTTLLAATSATAQTPGAEDCDSGCRAELEQARAATERYTDVTVANRDGFVESTPCQSSPQGTIGIQDVNLGRSDQTVDVESPESLLYVPEAGAGRRLVALEYSEPVLQDGIPYHGSEPPDPARIQPPPVLFGRQFTGPAPGRGPLDPWQYHLRVWLFSENPDGVFADANPAEACDAAGLVAQHATTEGCHEVHAVISAPAERVRQVGRVPDRFRLRGEQRGVGEVSVDTLSCDSIAVDGTAAPTKFTVFEVLLDPPDWVGVDPCCASRYLFRLVTDNPNMARYLRQGSGVGPDVIAYSPDLEQRFGPLVGTTGSYFFSTPDYELDATVTDPEPAGVTTAVRWWHETPRGMANLHQWLDGVRLGPAVVQVTPRPGTLLAEMVGCVPGPDPGSCKPISADSGLVVTWERGAGTAGLSDGP